ncbi:MAG TPA: monofunctional biosynthetic peptidoglycan transglycosylase [Thermoanaerobaculia bacterium]|nr:monofunctional biosynthetic peptidoglycan transglycosylase [Thermoanaerobaculia bacterium]
MKDGLTAQPEAEAPPADSAAGPAGLPFVRHIGRSRHLLRNLSLLLLFVLVFVVFIPLPQILLLRWRDPSSTAFIRARQKRLRAQGKNDAIDRRPVRLGQVAPALVQAVLTAEDSRFFEHHGIDWEAVSSAREWNQAHARSRRRRLHGASTLTQQLAKNLWLTGERSWWRKGREAVLASVLDLFVPKARILEIYLSAIEFGETTYGCEAASRALFGVSASRLSAPQAARLAALIPGPTWYRAHPAAWEHRADLIAQRMETQPLPAGLTTRAR